jgi:hypothetical protein
VIFTTSAAALAEARALFGRPWPTRSCTDEHDRLIAFVPNSRTQHRLLHARGKRRGCGTARMSSTTFDALEVATRVAAENRTVFRSGLNALADAIRALKSAVRLARGARATRAASSICCAPQYLMVRAARGGTLSQQICFGWYGGANAARRFAAWLVRRSSAGRTARRSSRVDPRRPDQRTASPDRWQDPPGSAVPVAFVFEGRAPHRALRVAHTRPRPRARVSVYSA